MVFMTLTEYLHANKLTASEFARQMGVSPQAVHRYCDGDRLPRKSEMEKILELTDGVVTPNDFFGVPPCSSPKGRRAS
jgi:transcriptional regulator with XRE-family HTH domain